MEIRRSYDRLISTMGFPKPARCHLYIESGPRLLPWLLMPWFWLHQVICSHGIIECDKPVLVFDKEGFQLPVISVLRNCTKCNYMFSKGLHATHLLKLLDKMCRYEMYPTSIVEDIELTRFCPQTDKRTDAQGETSISHYQLCWSG